MYSLLLLLGVMLYYQQSLRQIWFESKECYQYLYSIHHQNHYKTICSIISTFENLIKTYLIQYVCTNSKMIKKGLYEIEYTIHLKTYKIRIPYKRGPSKYRAFLNHEQNITSKIMPYVGPNDDFHNIPYTPNDFGYDHLTIEYSNGTIKQIEENSSILI